MNVAAASPALDRRTRVRLLRLGGMRVDNAIVEGGCYFFGADIAIGDGAMINHRAYFDTRAHIEIGPGAGIATDVMLCTSTHDMGPEHKRWGAYRTAPISVGAGAWVGIRAVVLPGVTIGDGAVVAAGAVVTGDVEPNIASTPESRPSGSASSSRACGSGAPRGAPTSPASTGS